MSTLFLADLMRDLFGNGAGWFTAPAIIGTIFFLLRLALMGVGGHVGDADIHTDVDVHADVHTGDAAGDHHTDSSEAFKILSVQGIAAFLMGFGWGGLATLRSTDWSWITAMAVAVVCGIAFVWLLGILLKAVYSLQSSGNVSIRDTEGHEGSVYVTIPAKGEGRGRVRVVINNRERIYPAVSDGEQLPRNAQVRIIRANEDNTVTVVALP